MDTRLAAELYQLLVSVPTVDFHLEEDITLFMNGDGQAVLQGS